jgi:hypothetical protein
MSHHNPFQPAYIEIGHEPGTNWEMWWSWSADSNNTGTVFLTEREVLETMDDKCDNLDRPTHRTYWDLKKIQSHEIEYQGRIDHQVQEVSINHRWENKLNNHGGRVPDPTVPKWLMRQLTRKFPGYHFEFYNCTET